MQTPMDSKKWITIIVVILTILVPTFVIIFNAYYGFSLYHKVMGSG